MSEMCVTNAVSTVAAGPAVSLTRFESVKNDAAHRRALGKEVAQFMAGSWRVSTQEPVLLQCLRAIQNEFSA
jgi:hypothetical protein